MMKIAIITGVTSGLGHEFLRAVNAKHPELEQIWVVARRVSRLEQLAEKYNKLRPVPLDLCDSTSIDELARLIRDEKPDIRVLINNAGFGELGNFYENDYKTQMAMVDLNNRALTAICTVCANYMSAGAYIINVASIASFAPTPRMAVYCSTKAYVTSFTRCIRCELKPRKVNALALCPGPMSTEFLDVAGISGGKSKTFETLPFSNPAKVADKAVVAAAKGRGVYTPRAFYKLYRLLAKILPHDLVMKFSKT